jgi:hypothetical protein
MVKNRKVKITEEKGRVCTGAAMVGSIYFDVA